MTPKDFAPQIILVRPQLAENIGMTARAMLNCGLYQMRLVAPRQSPTDSKALAASSGADKVLQQARIYETLQEAVADLNIVFATTARRRNQVKTIYTADEATKILHQEINAQKTCGILFGPERTGLENDEISMANAIVEIPLNPEHCSLNLAQAVLLLGYEWYKTTINAPKEIFQTNKGRRATKAQLIKFFEFLEDSLQNYKNLQDLEKRPALLRNLHNIFTRNDLTIQELNTLYGVINALKNQSSVCAKHKP